MKIDDFLLIFFVFVDMCCRYYFLRNVFKRQDKMKLSHLAIIGAVNLLCWVVIIWAAIKLIGG